MLGSKRWLLWCQCATRHKNPRLKNWNEESAVQRGVCSAICTSGVRRKLAAKFLTFSDIFRTPCFTVFDVQDMRNTISDNFRILPKIVRKFPHCAGPSEAWEGLGFGAFCGPAGVRFGRHILNTNVRRGEEGERKKKPNFTQLPLFQKPLFAVADNCGDGGIRITLQKQMQIYFRKIRIATISVRMIKIKARDLTRTPRQEHGPLFPKGGSSLQLSTPFLFSFLVQGHVFCIPSTSNMLKAWKIAVWDPKSTTNFGRARASPLNLIFPHQGQECYFVISKREKGRQKTWPPLSKAI